MVPPNADAAGAVDTCADLEGTAAQIGAEVAGPVAADVDVRARFPEEALAALKRTGMLGAAVPRAFGGRGASVVPLAEACTALAQHCSAAAMVLAMHQIQVLSLAYAATEGSALADYLRRLVKEQRLIASVTSEVGPSGDMRSSVAAVETTATGFRLVKQATTVSYGQQADDLLITARRAPSGAPSDQVMVLALGGSFELTNVGAWNTLGMRGTCSPGCTVTTQGEAWQVVAQPFADIATCVMVPTSHILWAACWLGIASDAVSKTRALVRSKARNQPGGITRAAQRATELVSSLQLMRHDVMTLARDYDELMRQGNKEQLASIAFALRINNLKLSASRLVVEIVSEALGICGIAAYKNDSPTSLGRHLRDAHSAALMINNDRLHETNASFLSIHKGE